MSRHAPGEVTLLLDQLQSGDRNAAEALAPYVYQELHRLAESYMRSERPGHTLQPTALVNEAYLRLVQLPNPNWQNRAHFIGVAAHLMRQILVEYARQHQALKRGGGQQKVEFEEGTLAALDKQSDEVLDLNSALDRLIEIDPRLNQVVEMRYFGGLTTEETAEALGVSSKTVKRDWNVARAWLRAEIGKALEDDEAGPVDSH